MPKNNVTSFINNHFVDTNYTSYFTHSGFQSLRTYMGNVVKGQPKVYTAPFAKGSTIQSVLDDWQEVLVSISDKWPSLWEFEMDLASKVGPLSVQKPLRERITDIAHYYEDILLSSTPIDPVAIKQTIGEFNKARGLRRRSQARTVEMMKKSTNSGNPFFTKRRNVVLDTFPCGVDYTPNPVYYLQDAYQMLPNNNDFKACAVIGWRGQEGGPEDEDVKQRVVWMFPFAVNIEELTVYQPLIETFQRFNLVPAWVSMESVDMEVTRLFDTKNSDDLVVCTDFTKFDQHFNVDLQNAAKTILQWIMSRERNVDDWFENVFGIKYMIPLLWEAQADIVSVFHGFHGMASGSGGTNVDETLAHRALQREAAIKSKQILNPHSMCLGDDGILSYPGITVNEVVDAYQSHGQECNLSKQYASTQDCVYLRRWHHKDYRDNGVCVGVYSTCRALGRLRYLERFMDPEYWSPQMVALRQLSIIENCKYHPLRDEFAEFCMKRDKYRLGIDIPGFLDKIATYAKESIDHMPDFLGYTKTLQGFKPTGISEWWIVKYLKSHR
uniref:RNA-dependent RNA polymerase n=1 Tax=Mongoose picobirnavirus TaxID=2684263 RepID=A0A6B9UQ08_9VIRU|nr:RNA-dependent RNA polymerase [Mongoose picobirnavirus]